MLHSICQQIWKIQQWPQDGKRSVFIPIPKKGNAKECSNYLTIALISHPSKTMLKILRGKLQQYVNQGLSDVQPGFRKDRGSKDQIASICWIIEKAREFQKNISALLITDRNELWRVLQEMVIPDQLIYLLRNLSAGQEATVRTRHGTWTHSKLGKEYVKAVYCHPAYLRYMQSTSCEMLGWMKHKLASRLLGETSITSDMQMTPPLWQKAKRN